jgi:hypothetical protein
MTGGDALARKRYFAMTAVRLVGVAGAVFGVILIARASSFGLRALGLAITVSALAFMATVPLSLARRWRTPPVV